MNLLQVCNKIGNVGGLSLFDIKMITSPNFIT